MAEDPRAKYGLSCPSGGSFYICRATETQFIGCCDHDPCTDEADGVCEGDALHPASFSSTNYIDIPPQSCAAPYNETTWWTCQNAKPPFLGCCSENPCNAGCKQADLLPARLSDNETNAAPFLVTTASSTPSPSAGPSDQEPADTPTGLIVGVSMGGTVLLLAVIAFFLWRRRQKEKKQEADREDGVQSQPQAPDGGGDPHMVMVNGQYSPYKDSYPSTVHSSPFPYQSSIGVSSPPMSTTSTCWSPRDNRFSHSHSHSRHVSQLSELSGEDYVHELPGTTTGLQPVSEIDGSSRLGRVERSDEPPGGVPHTPRGDSHSDYRQSHIL